jgi:hypothetical protein
LKFERQRTHDLTLKTVPPFPRKKDTPGLSSTKKHQKQKQIPL